MNGQAGTHASMYAAYFPGDPYTTTFEPTPEQSSSMIRLAGDYADDDSQAEVLLQMLGIIPSESAFNPTARDAWTKKPSRVPEKKPNVAVAPNGSTVCKQGHVRAEYSFLDPRGHIRCRKCHAQSIKASRERRKARAMSEAPTA